MIAASALGPVALRAAEAPAVEAERCREAVERSPGDVAAWSCLIGALARGGEDARAAARLVEIVENLLDAGRADLAETLFARHPQVGSERPEVAALRGRTLLLGQSYEAAVPELERAVALGSRDPVVKLRLAAADWQVGRIAEAEALYRELSDGPARGYARQGLGSLLVWQGRFAEAIEVLSPPPEDVTGRFDLARALAGAGRADEAIALFRRIVDAAPDHAKARYGLALLLARAGDPTGSAAEMERFRELTAAEQAATRDRGRLRARLDHGWQRLAAGEPEEAAAAFEALPPGAEALAGLAAARRATGDLAAAIAALERAVALEPDRPDLRLQLAELRAASAER